MLISDTIYKAADYLRLSKEDGDFSFSNNKAESDSISSQRKIIQRFVAQQPDIELVAEFSDDGYSGTSFERPQFQKMMEAVKAGEINCIIVKDLSRFGREYIDAGRYLSASAVSSEAFKASMYDAIERVTVFSNRHIEVRWKFEDLFVKLHREERRAV